jgi:prepilin-type processing-associated H-X9-DG protein
VTPSLRSNRGGFTLTELVVVIATTGILAVIVLPTLAFSKAKPQAVHCLNNYNQMIRACAMYASDYRELYPPNADLLSAYPGYNWVGGNVSGWMPNVGALGSSQAGNATYVTNASWSLLATYLGYQGAIFKCPADPRICIYNGQYVPVVRTASCNQGVGTIVAGWSGGDPGSSGNPPRAPVYGPWLTGTYNHAYSQYATFGKTTDFKRCKPSDIWVYVDDDPWTMNDAAMAVVAEETFIDWPGTQHGDATSFAFADGHSEMHRWQSTGYPLVHSQDPGQQPANSGLLYNDWYWWAWHATRNLNTGLVP